VHTSAPGACWPGRGEHEPFIGILLVVTTPVTVINIQAKAASTSHAT
jgi:hypothetical protein